MSDTELSIFADEPAAPEQAPEASQETQEAPPEVQEPEQAQEPVAEPEQSETGEPEAAPPVAEMKEEPHSVPITAMLDEREKRQDMQRELEQTRREMQQLQAQMRQKQEQQPAPDWFEDPAAAATYQAQQMQQQMQSQALRTSQFFAEREFGKELVDEAMSFFDQNPQLSQQFLGEPSPFHAAVEFFKGHKAKEEIGSDPEAWKAEQREKIRADLMAELQAQQPATPAPVRPPASLSKAPATSGNPNETAVSVPRHLTGLFDG